MVEFSLNSDFSGFIFLRLLCVAILNPKQFNLITGKIIGYEINLIFRVVTIQVQLYMYKLKLLLTGTKEQRKYKSALLKNQWA